MERINWINDGINEGRKEMREKEEQIDREEARKAKLGRQKKKKRNEK